MSYVKIDSIREERIGDELYLFGSDGQQLTVLNKTAMLIWSLCDGEHSVEEAALVMQDIFPDVAREELAADIKACAEEWIAQGFLRAANA